MKLNKKQVANQVKTLLNNSPASGYISDYDSSERPLLDSAQITVMKDLKDLGEALSLSTPLVVFLDDELLINVGKKKIKGTVKKLSALKLKDVIHEFSGKSMSFEVKLSKEGLKRKNFKSNQVKILDDYAKEIESQIEKVLNGKPQEDVVYLIHATDSESASIFDGSNCVASGNDWDFHADCHGLKKYKTVKLGDDWNGAGSLASILSAGLQKPVRKLNVTYQEMELLVGQTFLKDRKENYSSDKTMRQLYLETKKKEKEERLKNLDPDNMTQEGLLDLLKKSFDPDLCHASYKEENTILISHDDTDYLYPEKQLKNLEKFLTKYKGWSLIRGDKNQDEDHQIVKNA